MDAMLIPPLDAEQLAQIRQVLKAIPIEFWKYAVLATVAALAHGKVKWVYALLALLALLG